MLNSSTTCSGTQTKDGTDYITAQNCSTVFGSSTSTDPTFLNGFTVGEIVTNVQLFLILVTTMVLLYHAMFRRIKIRNQ